MSIKYRPDIDGLRAIAVGGVILQHAHVPLHGGFLGVDVFFVISGYLITLILLRELEQGKFSLAKFYERRARRILPALLTVLAVSCVIGWVVALPEAYAQFARSAIATVFFVSNVFMWRSSNYFAPDSGEIPLLHTWSLAVEEQFYIVFPIVLWALWRWRRKAILPLMAICVVLSLGVAEVAARHFPTASFYLAPFRAWELLIGGLAALAIHRGLDVRTPPALREAAAAAGLLAILASMVLLTETANIPGVSLLPSVLGSALIMVFAAGTATGRLLALRPFVGLGLISYSAYLWHQPLLAFARQASFETLSPLKTAGLVALTVLLAIVTYRFVETPFRKPRPGGAGTKKVLVLSGVGLAASALVGAVIALGQGFGPLRYAPERISLMATATPSPRRAACHLSPPFARAPDEACRFGEGPVTLALLGDSHGVELAHALGDAVAAQGGSLIQFTASGCPPALTFTPGPSHPVPGCHAFHERTVAYLEASAAQTVVLVFRHALYLYGQNETTFPSLPGTPYKLPDTAPEAARAAYWDSVETMARRLTEAGKTVLIVEPIPEIGRNIQRYAAVKDVSGDRLTTVTRPYYDRRMTGVADRLATVGTGLLPVAGLLCDDALCFGARGGQALYFDDNHLSMAGARYLVDLWQSDPALAQALHLTPADSEAKAMNR